MREHNSHANFCAGPFENAHRQVARGGLSKVICWGVGVHTLIKGLVGVKHQYI
jgi:hypothetical protein